MYESMLNSWRMTDLGYRDIKTGSQAAEPSTNDGKYCKQKPEKKWKERNVQFHE